jgi:apolipoprotein D and lipocalin family protein
MRNSLLLLALLMYSLSAVSNESEKTGRSKADSAVLETIASLDLPRYMGTWFEIAKFPNWFQKQCTGHTSARYSLQQDGTVQVINRCRLENGEMNSAIGTARQIGPQDSPKLKVRFAPAWLSFLPLVWGDYWVIDLDEQYQLVAVSEPTREYLWILSRTPSVDSAAYIQMLERLSSKGFEIHKLELTRQE